MPLNITPMSGPSTAPMTGAQSTPQLSYRDQAVAKLAATMQSQDAPVRNPSQVSAEEMSAVKAPAPSHSLEDASPAVTEAPSEPISSQYATLARKEKALRAKAQAEAAQYKAKEAALLAREEAFKAKEAEYQSKYIPKDRLKQDTINALAEAGLSYDEITNMMLNQPAQTPENSQLMNEFRAMKAELAAIKAAGEDTKKSYADSQTKAYQDAKTMIKQEALSLVGSDPAFETIKATNSVNDVVELIERTLNEDGIMLSVEEAANEVEKELSEKLYSYTSRIDKIKKRLQSSGVATPPAQSKQQSPQQQQLKTLTNTVSTSRPLSARERALLAFNNKLTS